MGSSFKRVDWGHVTFVLFIVIYVFWYFFDAYFASSSIKNLILIAPASALALTLCTILLIQDIRKAFLPLPPGAAAPARTSDEAKAADWAKMEKRRGTHRAVAFIATFGVYIGLLEIIGYDVATWLFIAAFLILNGERRPLVIVGFSLIFGSLAVWLFGLLLPYPMLTMVVPN